MMAEDLGVEAKEAAVREVAKLLSLPEHLLSIASIKADYISRQQVSFGGLILVSCFALQVYMLVYEFVELRFMDSVCQSCWFELI